MWLRVTLSLSNRAVEGLAMGWSSFRMRNKLMMLSAHYTSSTLANGLSTCSKPSLDAEVAEETMTTEAIYSTDPSTITVSSSMEGKMRENLTKSLSNTHHNYTGRTNAANHLIRLRKQPYLDTQKQHSLIDFHFIAYLNFIFSIY